MSGNNSLMEKHVIGKDIFVLKLFINDSYVKQSGYFGGDAILAASRFIYKYTVDGILKRKKVEDGYIVFILAHLAGTNPYKRNVELLGVKGYKLLNYYKQKADIKKIIKNI